MNSPRPLNPLTFPLHGTRLIEASAGTGKTYTIAALYVRLILGQALAQTALLPPEILVVTFTEAATKELRERIRQRLTEAARCFRGVLAAQTDDEFLLALLASYPLEQHAVCARSLEVAAEWMDEAAIYTIHSWCKRMLRQHAFASGSLFDLELDAVDSELLSEVVRDYWRKFYYPLPAATTWVIQQWATTPEDLANKIKPLLSLTGLNAQPEPTADIGQIPSCFGQWQDWEDQRQHLAQQARNAWRQDRAAIAAMLSEASEKGWLNGTSYRKADFPARLQAVADWAEHNRSCEPKILEGFGQDNFKMVKAHQDKIPSHPAFVCLQALTEHISRQPDIKQPALLHAAAWVAKRYSQEKQRRARLDFDDLLANLHKALHSASGNELAQILRSQFPIAMIDEFQDTDPIQYAIFNKVYPVAENAENTGLFMIGDPKQAIYSFRGADIFTYLQARLATQDRHYTLTTNYRSTQALVSAVNRIFSFADQHPQGAFQLKPENGDNPVPFFPVVAQGRQDSLLINASLQPALSLWHQASAAAISKTEYLAQMAKLCADEIVRLLNLGQQQQAGFSNGEQFKALKPADIAVLVRDFTEAKTIQDALSQRKVSAVYLSDRDSVFHSQEAVDVLLWLKACAEPNQDRLLRAALATTTLRQSYQSLDLLNQDELAWESEMNRFHQYRKLWRWQGVLAMLRQILHDFNLPQQLLQAVNGERILTNLLHLAELLQSASMQGDGEQSLIRYLAERISEVGQTADEHIVRLESEADLVKIVTIHKSKGLEYPLVFMPFVCTFKEVASKNKSFYSFHNADQELQIDLALAETSRQQADAERLQEDLRLLYVALTRARHACWLGIAALKVGNSKSCQLHKSAIGTILNAGAVIEATALADLLIQLKGDCADIAIIQPPAASENIQNFQAQTSSFTPVARQFTGSKPRHWWIASYTAIKQDVGAQKNALAAAETAPDSANQANLLETDDVLEEPIPTAYSQQTGLHSFPRGAQPGTFLHSVLEWAAKEGFAQIATQPTRRLAFISKRCHSRGWEAWSEGLDAWLTSLLNSPILLIQPLTVHAEPLTVRAELVEAQTSFQQAQGERIFKLHSAESIETPTLSLATLAKADYQAELEFWFSVQQANTLKIDDLLCQGVLPGHQRPALLANQLNGMLKGFIDLVFCHQNRYYLIDYKSNRLGNDNNAYQPAAMRDEILKKRYDLQYVLYLLALHRQLKARLGAAYDYDQHIGGAIYWFIRAVDSHGHGLFFDKPAKAVIEHLDQLFQGINSAD